MNVQNTLPQGQNVWNAGMVFEKRKSQNKCGCHKLLGSNGWWWGGNTKIIKQNLWMKAQFSHIKVPKGGCWWTLLLKNMEILNNQMMTWPNVEN